MEPTILSNGENMYKTFSTGLFHLHFLCTLHFHLHLHLTGWEIACKQLLAPKKLHPRNLPNPLARSRLIPNEWSQLSSTYIYLYWAATRP